MSFDVCGINDLILAEVTSFFIILEKKETYVKNQGTQMAGKNTICTTREIVAQNRQVRLGALCTAWTVTSELEEGFACTFFFFFFLPGQAGHGCIAHNQVRVHYARSLTQS